MNLVIVAVIACSALGFSIAAFAIATLLLCGAVG